MTVIYRQLIMNDISLFTSQPKAKFYDELFINLNLDSIPDRRCEKGRQGYSRHAMICAVIVMKCECFSYITDLVDYLNNNLLIADLTLQGNCPDITLLNALSKILTTLYSKS